MANQKKLWSWMQKPHNSQRQPTAHPSWGNFVGCQCDGISNLSWPLSCTGSWMACLDRTLWMTASLPPPTADNFDRPNCYMVPRTRTKGTSLGEHSLLLDHGSETTYLSTYSTCFWTYAYPLIPMTHLAETRTWIQRPVRVSGASCNKICTSFQR